MAGLRFMEGTVSFRLMKISIYCFIAAYPFSVNVANGIVLLVCFFALLTSNIQYKKKVLKSTKELWPYIALFFFFMVGVTYSSQSKYALRNIESSVYLLIMPVLFSTARPLGKKSIRFILKLFVIVTFAAAIICLIVNVRYFIINDIDFKNFLSWEYTYQHLSRGIGLHPTYFAIMILISFFIVLFEFQTEKAYEKVFKYFLMSFLFCFLILLGAKIGLIIFFVLINITLIAYFKTKGPKAIVLYVFVNFLLVFLALKTPVVYWRFRVAIESTVSTLSGKTLSDYRLIHWRCAVEKIRESPFWGYGTGDAKITLNQCYEKIDMEHLYNYNAHNQLFDSWLKVGLPGLLLTFLCLAVPLHKSYKSGNYLFAIIFSIFLCVSFTESILAVQKGMVLFCFVVSLYLGHVLNQDKRDEKELGIR